MPHPDDNAGLMHRIESGASVRAIAAELSVTERTVRNRLRRAGIPLPSERRAAGVDLEAILADYREGMPVQTIAGSCVATGARRYCRLDGRRGIRSEIDATGDLTSSHQAR